MNFAMAADTDSPGARVTNSTVLFPLDDNRLADFAPDFARAALFCTSVAVGV